MPLCWAEGAQEWEGEAVASSSRGLGSSMPTAQLVCTPLPAPGQPGRIPRPPVPGMRVAAGIKVPHSPRVCCQLSALHPFSSGPWKLPVCGLCFACVLRRGAAPRGFLLWGLRFEWKGTSPQVLLQSSYQCFHSSAHAAIAVPQNREGALTETAWLCRGRNL